MKGSAFGFLVHPRNLNDVYIKFPFFRLFPKKIVLSILRKMPPVLVSPVIGLKDKKGDKVKGYIISIPLTAKQMIEDREFALQKMKEAVRYAYKKGVRIIGLGALTASLSNGGLSLKNTENNMGFTTGRAYTVKTVTNYVKDVIKNFYFDKKDVQIAIVGAAGSIGSGCAEYLAEWGVNHFLLIDLEKKLEVLEKTILRIHQRISHDELVIKKKHTLENVKLADIVITATNAPEVILTAVDLKSGAIVINDAQPSDIADDVYNRDDVLVIEGGVVSTPGITTYFNFGLAHKEEVFCCLGEVLVLAHHEHYNTFTIGHLERAYLKKVEEMAQPLNFSITKYQNRFGYIKEEKIAYVKDIILNRES